MSSFIERLDIFMKNYHELCSQFPKQHESFLKDFFLHCPTQVIQQIRITKYQAKHQLISTFQNSSYVFLLLEGKLQAIEERVVDIPYSFTELTPIDIVGDYELFTGIEGHYVTLSTLEPSWCLELPANAYLNWMSQDVHALFIRTQMLMKVLSKQTQQQRQYTFMSNEMKLYIYLSTYMKQQDNCEVHIVLATREQIAAQIGCSIRTLNRLLLCLKQDGFIYIHHGKVQITKRQVEHITHELEVHGYL